MDDERINQRIQTLRELIMNDAVFERLATVEMFGVNVLNHNHNAQSILRKFLEFGNFNFEDSLANFKQVFSWRAACLHHVRDFQNLERGGVEMRGFDFHSRPVLYLMVEEHSTPNDLAIPINDGVSMVPPLAGVILQQFEEHPEYLNWFLVVHFTGDVNYAQRTQFKKSLKWINTYYPRFFNDELYIGGCFDIPCSIGTEKVRVPLHHAHWHIFNIIPAQHVPVKYGGIPPFDDGENGKISAGHVDVNHESRRKVKLICSQGSKIRVRVRVIGWNVIFGAAFKITGDSDINIFPRMIREPKLVSPENAEFEDFTVQRIELDGNIVLTFENHSFSTKKIVYLCRAEEE